MSWAVFDLNGTLLDVGAVGDGLLHEALFAAMTLNHVGEYRPLPELLVAAAQRRHDALGAPGPAEVAAAAAGMPAFPEAAEALDLLAGAGLRLAVLTNSPTERAEAGLRAAGLRDRFAHVVGSDRVGVFKPDGRVYRHGLAVLGAEPQDATMVAAHWWDLRGARAAGLRVAWVARGEGALSTLLPAPDAQGADLREVARAIVELPRREPAPAGLVRRATSADAAAVAGLLHDFNEEFDTPTPGPAVLARRLGPLLDGGDAVALVAEDPPAAVALMTFRPNVWFGGPVALLDELYVRPALRGGGIGTALLQRACALARERGSELMEIQVDEVDAGARRFYERHGFANGDPDGEGRALYYFREL